ncbi:uncharacterized protein DUF1120 [Pseudomonas sp. SJZ103]|uniref:DUF1120 domain-containing protein n=1 Tax=unclassified Pseudomonas TaxID=196821 RepID=UPI0011A8B7E6|nr:MULTISPECIES: DUF1120 domain-containing protein [unclassified Pseudomonas]MBB6288422.1 hypothetical protein [Pseudomonas sp. SJZ073]MBB6313394.1 hypothetical protein [Pseudomonas sp. JAI120]NJJ55443.1 DUF1120 domain-containing protein [Pseudomonas sp. B14(2022)]TWC74721.1 uncharacterized protein DUF1120 [Pseudomonas sp. SJZ103]TWC93150.1 uncharacterized protein DUF1120 [Pseudomonas sp. SJZ094]
MSKSLILLSAALLLTSATSTFAASSVDLTVKGLITPSACTLTLPGTVDFGKISAKDLNQDGTTRLEDKTLQLTVNCEAQTLFAINPVDNRAGTSSNSNIAGYGLGLINGTEKLGLYVVIVRNPVADIPSDMLQFRDGAWRMQWDDDYVEPNRLIAFGSFVPDVGYLPHPLENASVEVLFNTWIAPANTLTLTDEVALDGSATLEVKYL